MTRATVKLNSILKRLSSLPDDKEVVFLPDGSCIKDLLVYLNLGRGEVEIILMNGSLVNETKIIENDSFIELYPIFGGG
ncbi:MAG: hypothetical protein ACOYI2_04600 [Bacillota bacterium]|jgi:sulfur carrier protein ThiS|nr:hypothetical protein [Clostridia bacterium]